MSGKHINIALFIPHEGCPHQCSFCNQRSISGAVKKPRSEDVKAAVETALRSRDCTGAQLAFFGGSFTAIRRDDMLELLDAAQPYLKKRQIAGIRVSTRPDAVDTPVLALLKQYGVTAIELGAQSMDDRVLFQNGRGHTAQDVEDASRRIQEMGFELGLQMMTGLPGDTPEGSVDSARRLLSLRPDTMRIYPTIVLEGTPLARLYRAGIYIPQPLEEAVKLCAALLLLCEEAGVPVIRLGLHAGGEVQEGYLAGPWHPAFRELCEGELYYQNACSALQRILPRGGKAILRVAPRFVSQMAGQRRRNLERLKEQGFDCRVKADASCQKYEVKSERQR